MPISKVSTKEKVTTKSTSLFLKSFNLGDRHFWGTDHHAPRFIGLIHELVNVGRWGRTIGITHRNDVTQVFPDPLQSIAAILFSLLNRFGDMHWPHETGFRTINNMTMQSRFFFPDFQVVIQHLKGRRFSGGNGNQTNAVFACQF